MDGSRAAVALIVGLHFGGALRLVGNVGKWIEASQVVTTIETLGDKTVRANEDTTNSMALGPGEEGLILAL